MSNHDKDKDYVLIITTDGTYVSLKGMRITIDSTDVDSVYIFNNGDVVEHLRNEDMIVGDFTYNNLVINFK